jgi:hypothetical protein
MRQDLAALACSLPEVQKVNTELVAGFRSRRFGNTRPVSTFKGSLTPLSS